MQSLGNLISILLGPNDKTSIAANVVPCSSSHKHVMPKQYDVVRIPDKASTLLTKFKHFECSLHKINMLMRSLGIHR